MVISELNGPLEYASMAQIGVLSTRCVESCAFLDFTEFTLLLFRFLFKELSYVLKIDGFFIEEAQHPHIFLKNMLWDTEALAPRLHNFISG